MRADEGASPTGVGGWLGLLCRVLVFWQPLIIAIPSASALNSLSVRGAPLLLVIVGRLIVAGFGVAAGLALWKERPAAVRLALMAFALFAAMDVFVFATPYFPDNSPPGDSTIILAVSLAWYTAWVVYLWRSKRVRNTFGGV